MLNDVEGFLGKVGGFLEDAGEFIVSLPNEIIEIGERLGNTIYGGATGSTVAEKAKEEAGAFYADRTGAGIAVMIQQNIPLILLAVGGYLAIKSLK